MNNALDIIKLIWPVILIQLAVQIYALVDVLKKNKTKNLSVGAWVAIILLGEIVGPILYFVMGRSED